MTYKFFLPVFMLTFCFSSHADTYRYKVKTSGVIQPNCKHEGKTEKSRIKMILSGGQQRSKLTPVRLRARVCTSVGFVRMSPRVVLPMSFMNQFEFGDQFNDFTMSFSPKAMTAINGKKANKVVVSNAGINPKDVKRAGFSNSRIQWIKFEWKNGSSRVFGPVYIGVSPYNRVRVRGFSPRSDIPATHIVLRKSGRWVGGTLNEIQ